MRNLKKWNERVKFKILKRLTPRLQQDLMNIPAPKLNKVINSTFIWGDSKTGKSVLAAFMLLEEEKQIYLEAREDKCVFVSVTDLTKEIKSCFNNPDKNEFEVLEYYQNVHLLVLDDFGSITNSDWSWELFYSIINHRYEYLKKTIYTSNKGLNEIVKILNDKRITSRIERTCVIAKKSKYKK